MVTAFVDMVGLLIVIPLLPLYAVEMGAGGAWVGVLVSAYALAQLLSAPLWGRVSDRYGRRPALLVSLAASTLAYVVFAYADTLWILLLSRLVQGAGGGTTGVVQAYVADATAPANRARALGWLSASTSLGVMVGPLLGSTTQHLGAQAPGLVAAGLCVLNAVFAWAYLPETHVHAPREADAPAPVRSGDLVARVVRAPTETAPRLIWMYSIGMGAFSGFTAVLVLFLEARFGITAATVGFVFAWNGLISVLARGLLLGPIVDRLGEPRLARVGLVLLGLGLVLLPLTARVEGVLRIAWAGSVPGIGAALDVPWRILALGAVISLVPLGTAFTFPCVTALLSRVIDPAERGVTMGVQQSFGGAARVLGPLWAGFAWDHLGTPYPFWTSALLVFLTLLLGIGLEAHVRRSEDALAAGPAARAAARAP
jgi:multidrug resistance protein